MQNLNIKQYSISLMSNTEMKTVNGGTDGSQDKVVSDMLQAIKKAGISI